MWKTMFDGSLGRDAELKQVGDSPCCSFSVAVNYYEKKEKLTAWVDVSLFGPRAVTVAPMLLKGAKVVVMGSQKLRTFDSKDGPKTVVDVRADDVEIVKFAGDGQGAGASQGGGGGDYAGAGAGFKGGRGRY
jgi:single-stranded DNA-binding protein